MKVFVYSKKTSEKIATITGVVAVKISKNKIAFFTGTEWLTFDTRIVKTTTYQN